MNMCLDEVLEKARKYNMAVLVKHNMEDGFKRGIQIPESIEIAKEIERAIAAQEALDETMRNMISA